MALDPDVWHRMPVPLCPKAQHEPDPCDCGYVGAWVVRHWKERQRCEPTYALLFDNAPGEVVRRCADCKAGGDGHDLYAGWEERCPRCGDVERFRWDGTLVEQRRNLAYSGSRDHTQDNLFSLLADGTDAVDE